jgi:L-malate glycosyltransferase
LFWGEAAHEDTIIIHDTIRDLGIEDDVILAGYRSDDYFSMISTFDVFVMMRAGSDGTARALREVMSLGVPPVVSDLGMLPELVDDGINGFVVKKQENILAEKIIELLSDEDKRQSFGNKAKEKALNKWIYKNQAVALMKFYKELLDSQG